MVKRKHVIATVCILLVWAAIIVLVRLGSSTAPPASGSRVVTQDGAITVLPNDSRSKMTITATLPTNNPTAKPTPKDTKP